MEANLIPANIVIGDRTYRIKILPADEEHVRRTLKIINDKILEFRAQFAGKDMQDYISMVLIWFATQPKNASNEKSITNDYLQILEKISNQLTEFTS
jgi:cell division protein ZapA